MHSMSESQQQLLKLGEELRASRTAMRLSQEDFAERCNLHRTYVGAIERGEVNISWEVISRLARALKLKPSDLLQRAGL